MTLNSEVLTSRKSLPVQPTSTSTEVTLSPVSSHINESGADDVSLDEAAQRQKLLTKVASLLQRSASQENSGSGGSAHQSGLSSQMSSNETSIGTIIERAQIGSPLSDRVVAKTVKETSHVSLEYDPKSRRKVLNTYEILREIGRGEHGKVKLARDLLDNSLVAIKIVSRKSKDKSLRMRRHSNLPPTQSYMNDYEAKIRREIAIMKRCNHKYIVNLREVLDDRKSFKIYLVLEYMDRGEIMWKRQSPITNPRPHDNVPTDKIPCCVTNRRATITTIVPDSAAPRVATEDNDLLSNEFSPNLTFRQSRRIFRDVLLGLEYLHMQGIVHRDIKPANLLVSSDYRVKISDFGVSFASSLGSSDDGVYFNEMELAKTVGTPAFFAPELCQTSISTSDSASNISKAVADSSDSLANSFTREGLNLPKVDHKIDIWALGVTLYCLLFGRVPFNAESEFALFDVIVHQELQFPESPSSFHSPQEVTEYEFELAKDLLRKMLDKNSQRRLDITEIKQHPFVLLDLENNIPRLHELFFLNLDYTNSIPVQNELDPKEGEDSDDPAVGIARRVGGSLLKAFNQDSVICTRKPSVENQIGLENNGQALERTDSARTQATIVKMQADNSSMSTSDNTDAGSSPTSPKATFSPVNSCPAPALPSAPGISFNTAATTATATATATSSTRKGSLLHDVLDAGSSIRRDSVGSQEASQIETKRNVGGDLYMKNQSAIDAFKDIQKSDDKRRRSSLYKTLSRTSSVSGTPKLNKTTEGSPLQTEVLPIPIDSPDESESSFKVKVGPISMDSNRRPSSVLSLPLTESIASLDSLSDAYLASKYHEYRSKKKAMLMMDTTVTHSDPALARDTAATDILTEKFKNFNFGNSISKGYCKNGHEEIEPMTSKRRNSGDDSSHSDSYSSESSRSYDSSSENEEEGNLTLKFTSKVAPRSRPPFLNLNNRAFSHDSNLTDMLHSTNASHYSVPFMLDNQLLEVEDVPENLMGTSQVPSLAAVGTPVGARERENNSNGNGFDASKIKKSLNNPVHGSPLRCEVDVTKDHDSPARPSAGLGEQLSRYVSSNKKSTIVGGYFNNHYKKERVLSPMPYSKHLDMDRESVSKQITKGIMADDPRPHYNRSNSITLGLLQHEPHNFE